MRRSHRTAIGLDREVDRDRVARLVVAALDAEHDIDRSPRQLAVRGVARRLHRDRKVETHRRIGGPLEIARRFAGERHPVDLQLGTAWTAVAFDDPAQA